MNFHPRAIVFCISVFFTIILQLLVKLVLMRQSAYGSFVEFIGDPDMINDLTSSFSMAQAPQINP